MNFWRHKEESSSTWMRIWDEKCQPQRIFSMIHRATKWIERFRRIEHRSKPHSTRLCQTLTRLDHHPLTNSNLSNELPSIHTYHPGFFFRCFPDISVGTRFTIQQKKMDWKTHVLDVKMEHCHIFSLQKHRNKTHEFEASSSNLATSWRHGSKSHARPFRESLGVAKMKWREETFLLQNDELYLSHLLYQQFSLEIQNS